MRYVCRLFTVTLAVLAGAALLNMYLDPFGVWHSYTDVARMNPVTHAKPGIDSDPRFAKPLQVISLKPQTIIVGSSRVRDGMDPALLDGLVPAPIMNYGTAGMRATEGARFIRHAVDVAQVKTVIWGLDFFGFNDLNMNEMGKDGFDILRARPRVNDVARLLIAWPTMELSGEMFNGKAITRPNGFNHAPATPPAEILHSILRNAVGFGNVDFLYGNFQSFAAHMAEFEQAIAYATSKGVQVYLYTSPLHGLVMEAIFQKNSQQAFLAWKKAVASVAQKYNVPIYDYMTYNSITTADGAEAATYFFDGAHFTPLVSRLILGKFFAVPPAPGTEVPADFGQPLTTATIDKGWARLLTQRQNYVAGHASEVESLVKQLQ